MARISRDKVEYFPHYCAHSKSLKIIESKFGDSGYAFWFRLLELLGDTDGHVYRCDTEPDVEYLHTLYSITTVEKPFLPVEILNTCAALGMIDPELWEEKVIWCQNFVDGLEPVYKNRKRPTPKKPITTVVIRDLDGITTSRNATKQRRVEKSREERENSDARAREDNIIPMQRWEPGGIEYRTMDKFQELYNTVIAHPHKESDAVNQIVHLADKYGDPEQVIPEMMAMLARLKDEDQTARGFWRKPYLPSTLVSHWSQVLEELKTAKADAEEWEDIDEEENVWS